MSALQRQIMALNPVGYWPLDERSGTTAFDRSGNGRNGTYNGSPSLASRSFLDGKLYADFDGSNDYINITSHASLTTVTDFAVSTWSYADTLPSEDGAVIYKGTTGSNHEWWINGYNTGVSYINCGLVNTSNGGYLAISGPNAVAGQWKHYAWTYALGSNTLILYVDGAFSSQTTTTTGTKRTGTADLLIGKVPYFGQYFNGIICHCSVYNAVLTAEQIASLYKAGIRSGVSY